MFSSQMHLLMSKYSIKRVENPFKGRAGLPARTNWLYWHEIQKQKNRATIFFRISNNKKRNKKKEKNITSATMLFSSWSAPCVRKQQYAHLNLMSFRTTFVKWFFKKLWVLPVFYSFKQCTRFKPRSYHGDAVRKIRAFATSIFHLYFIFRRHRKSSGFSLKWRVGWRNTHWFLGRFEKIEIIVHQQVVAGKKPVPTWEGAVQTQIYLSPMRNVRHPVCLTWIIRRPIFLPGSWWPG